MHPHIVQFKEVRGSCCSALKCACGLPTPAPTSLYESAELNLGDPSDWFEAGKSHNKKIYIYDWLDDNKDNPATKVSD